MGSPAGFHGHCPAGESDQGFNLDQDQPAG